MSLIQHLSIDLETRSSVEIGKSGVYRYLPYFPYLPDMFATHALGHVKCKDHNFCSS